MKRLRRGDYEALVLEEQRQRLEPAALEALGLSRREAEVLAWVAEGKTNRETAMDPRG